MKVEDAVSCYISMWLISVQTSEDFSKFFSMAVYKILKSLYQLEPAQVSNMVYSMGRNQHANDRILKAYKRSIEK